jgi:hypothetical protein
LYSFENKNAGNNYNSQGQMSQASFGKLQEQPSKPKRQIPKVPKLDFYSTKTQKIGQSHPNLLENSGRNQSPEKHNPKTMSSRRSHGTLKENDHATNEIHQQLTSLLNTYYKEEEGLDANLGFLSDKEGTQPVSQQNSSRERSLKKSSHQSPNSQDQTIPKDLDLATGTDSREKLNRDSFETFKGGKHGDGLKNSKTSVDYNNQSLNNQRSFTNDKESLASKILLQSECIFMEETQNNQKNVSQSGHTETVGKSSMHSYGSAKKNQLKSQYIGNSKGSPIKQSFVSKNVTNDSRTHSKVSSEQ